MRRGWSGPGGGPQRLDVIGNAGLIRPAAAFLTGQVLDVCSGASVGAIVV